MHSGWNFAERSCSMRAHVYKMQGCPHRIPRFRRRAIFGVIGFHQRFERFCIKPALFMEMYKRIVHGGDNVLQKSYRAPVHEFVRQSCSNFSKNVTACTRQELCLCVMMALK